MTRTVTYGFATLLLSYGLLSALYAARLLVVALILPLTATSDARIPPILYLGISHGFVVATVYQFLSVNWRGLVPREHDKLRLYSRTFVLWSNVLLAMSLAVTMCVVSLAGDGLREALRQHEDRTWAVIWSVYVLHFSIMFILYATLGKSGVIGDRPSRPHCLRRAYRACRVLYYRTRRALSERAKSRRGRLL